MFTALRRPVALLLPLLALAGTAAFANEGGSAHSYAATFLWIAVLLIAAKIAGLVERVGQASVLGELVMGVILGNLVLLNIHIFEPAKENGTLAFLAELGVVILLFQVGLESNIQKMRRVGLPAFLVAIVGVVLPFVTGTYLVGPWMLPGLSTAAYLFLGAALTATSVGITARVFKDLGKLQMPEAQIVLGAAVIDDVLGLIILAVVSAIATSRTVSALEIGWITSKALLFLIGAILVGQLAAPQLGKAFSKIQTGIAMKFTLAIAFCLIFAAAAQWVGLAPIVGAFAAGLVLDPVHFRYFKDPKVVADVKEAMAGCNEETKQALHAAIEPHAHRHIEDLIEPVGHFLVPLFFVLTGMSVKLETMFNGSILLTALIITLVAFVGKIAAGLAAGPVRKWLVGWGMVPRGEVGLIFATIGKSLGVVSDEMFSVIVIVIIFTTLLTPPVLSWLLRHERA